MFLQDLYGGGAERMMLQLATKLADRGFRVDLVLIRREGAYLGRVPANLPIHELGTRRMIHSVAALGRWLRRERPDALITALPHVNVGALLAKELARTGTRVVVTEHSMITKQFPSLKQRTLRMAYRMVPLMYPRAARVVAVSGGVADDLAGFARMPRERIQVIYNGVITPELHRLADEPCGHPWLAPDKPPVILGAGRLVGLKGFENLVRAFALVRARQPARLLIVGEGEQREGLLKLASELGVAADVDLPGFVSNPFPLMKRASVFVQSSRWEGLPTVLIEALACGTPIVATDCPGGTREILDDGALGRLVPVDDPEALAQGIQQALDQPFPAATSAQKINRFSLDAMADAYLQAAFGQAPEAGSERPLKAVKGTS